MCVAVGCWTWEIIGRLPPVPGRGKFGMPPELPVLVDASPEDEVSPVGGGISADGRNGLCAGPDQVLPTGVQG
jgi:hypothetical protein